ncbi:hypothetical protein [Kordiimonas pumila]|uniref:SPOR domain-containing protein n=1 Tax=Kordiimonas pumila TaxID=2161677 RepID=A0ABV7D0D3_9PROT|nr:hypothetical protein [Kordiimonas pumila]
MRGLNKKMKQLSTLCPAGTALVVLLTGLITACSPSPYAPTTRSQDSENYSSYMQQTIEAAMCEGRADDVVKQLTSEPLASPIDRFYLALALEESGHPSRAQGLYAQLMQAGYDGYVRIKCGREAMVDGSLSEEAARRLATVARNLAVLDANLRPEPRLPEGLPEREPKKETSGTTTTYNGPPIDVTRPDSQSPFGQWFSHLASYSSFESAVSHKSTLEAKYPALQGILDQWETVVKGKTAIRLGIRSRDKADAQAFCTAVKSQGEYCAVIDTAL